MESFFLNELRGHSRSVAVSACAMGFAGYASSYFEASSYAAANISSGSLPGLVASIFLAGFALLPAAFVTLGMYALVDASQESFRYELGVFASQGIEGYTIVDTWSSLYGWIPMLAYALGLTVYFAGHPGAFYQLEGVLADIISGLVLVAALPGFVLIPRKLGALLETSPYVVVRGLGAGEGR